MHITPRSAVIVAATALFLGIPSLVAAQTAPASPAPAAVAQAAAPLPTPTPRAFTMSGFFRSYYFTRQNASNNPGV